MSRLIAFVLTAAWSASLLPVALHAQDAQPATQPDETPATVPAAVPIDTSSPRGALKVLTRAMDEGDVATAEAVMLAENDNERDWAAAMLKLSTASVTARKASVTAFGEEGARAIIGDASAASAFAQSAIDRSTEELNGETAVVRSGDGVEGPIELRKVGDAWRVPVKVFVGDAPADKLTETAGKMTRQAGAIEAFCVEMTAGRYKTPEDAAQALQLAQVKAVFGEEAPDPAPATQQTEPG